MSAPSERDLTARCRSSSSKTSPRYSNCSRVNLVDAGYEVRAAADAESAQREIAAALPSLVLLDWMLPGKSGLALAKELRGDARTRVLPIIMVTARTDEADKVAGLEAWVDDYVTKPFSPRELKARIKSVLRRRLPEAVAGTPGGRRAHARSGDASRHGRRRRRSRSAPRNSGCCGSCSRGPERVHSRAQLLDHVWGNDAYIEERTVDVHIRRLRQALEPFGQDALIETVRGSGYRLAVPRRH